MPELPNVYSGSTRGQAIQRFVSENESNAEVIIHHISLHFIAEVGKVGKRQESSNLTD